MRILVAHNFYQLPGGEDRVFDAEKRMLVGQGNEVVEYSRHNSEFANIGLVSLPGLAAGTVWNLESYRNLRKIIREFQPDVAHFHNTFPLLSPSVYGACWGLGVPVVQTLHNWRIVCPSGGLFYQNHYCDDCVGKKIPWPGIMRGCYRGSRLQTGVLGMSSYAHHVLGTWSEKIARYIVLGNAFREKMIGAGFPAERIAVKPHFLEDPGQGSRSGGYAIYAGRLTREKGVHTLLAAWKTLRGHKLVICGSGPLEEEVRQLAAADPERIAFYPFLPQAELMALLQKAAFLVWPSESIETFGMIALESLACGVPVISSGVTAVSDLVVDGQTGLTFRVSDSSDLADKIGWAFEHPEEISTMAERARKQYLGAYTPAKNYIQLVGIYEDAIAQQKAIRGDLGRNREKK